MRNNEESHTTYFKKFLIKGKFECSIENYKKLAQPITLRVTKPGLKKIQFQKFILKFNSNKYIGN